MQDIKAIMILPSNCGQVKNFSLIFDSQVVSKHPTLGVTALSHVLLRPISLLYLSLLCVCFIIPDSKEHMAHQGWVTVWQKLDDMYSSGVGASGNDSSGDGCYCGCCDGVCADDGCNGCVGSSGNDEGRGCIVRLLLFLLVSECIRMQGWTIIEGLRCY